MYALGVYWEKHVIMSCISKCLPRAFKVEFLCLKVNVQVAFHAVIDTKSFNYCMRHTASQMKFNS